MNRSIYKPGASCCAGDLLRPGFSQSARRTAWFKKKYKPVPFGNVALHSFGKTRRLSARFIVCALTMLLGVSIAHAQTMPGTQLDNVAHVSYSAAPGAVIQVDSNPVQVVTVWPETNAIIDFIKVNSLNGNMTTINATSCMGSGGVVTMPSAKLLDGTTITAGSNQLVASSGLFHTGEPLFIQLVDPDQNISGYAIDQLSVTVSVTQTGDQEEVILSESNINTGVFIGYVPTAAAPAVINDCVLQVSPNAQAQVSYIDPTNSNDRVVSNALVDPTGVVFDSGTGQPIDGAVVTLIDLATNTAANVLGDDGVSTYPAQVISGGAVTDSSGALYQFAPGQFRFPFIAPGNYRLLVVPPAGYAGPSTVPIADLQRLTGAPFALQPASFGGNFALNPGPVVNIDIPLDPSSAELFLQKSTPLLVAAIGDFVVYDLRLDNANNVSSIVDVRISDRLPPGFRFVFGSAVMDGTPIADPMIDSDGRLLTFELGTMVAAASRHVHYVAEVTTAVNAKEAVNVAVASGAGAVQSNMASATVRIKEDLFASNSILVGRVIVGSCDEDVSNDEHGLNNVRVYMEDGRYAVTDEGGRFHFAGLEPGAHVVQLDVDSVPRHLEILPCQNNSRFAGRSFSQFVDLQPGSLWRADFHVQEIPPPKGSLGINLSSTPRLEFVDYTLTLEGDGEVSLHHLRAMVLMPDRAEYVTGSSTLNGVATGNPDVSGPALSYKLKQRSGQWQDTLKFTLKLLPSDSRERITKAMALFDSASGKKQRTPLVDNLLVFAPPESARVEWTLLPDFDPRDTNLSVNDKRDIDSIVAQLTHAKNIRVRATGHTDNVRIAPQNRHQFADNQALSEDRARKVGQYVRELLNLPPSQITTEGQGSSAPVASNKTVAGRAQNRRVELMVWAETPRQDSVTLVASESRLISQAASTKVAGLVRKETRLEENDAVKTDLYADATWVDRLLPGIELLLPEEGFNPAIPSLKIALKHGHKNKLLVTLNGHSVSGIHFDGVSVNANKTVAISRWRGANLQPGNNDLVIVINDQKGRQLKRIQRNVHFSQGPVLAKLNQTASALIADGRSRPHIVFDMVDREGFPARPDAVGIYHIDPPYRAQWEVDAARENQLIVVGDRDPVYTINEHGQAVIELEPTSRAGEVVLHFSYANKLQQEVRAWLQPAARDWILIGLAEGTVGFNQIKNNLQNAADDELEDNYYDDGRVAFFAKGRVKGDYLLTLAYDTKGDREKDQNRLFGTIDPDRFYTLYGDATEQRFDAASQEKLYLKIERGQFYALFGDHQTAMTVTELAKYNRTLNGLKSEYSGRHFAYNMFAAQTNLAFVKDEISGNGTSGLYKLSRNPIVINSEKIVLEVRDRFHSEQIIESRSLARHLDYNIDYLNGTLFFKQPVTSRDQQLNPVYIVADYESRDQQDEELIAGGRAAMKMAQGTIEFGISAISEGTNGGDGELYGADMRVAFRPGTELRGEYATSDSMQNGLTSSGDAWLLELKHQGEKLESSIYTREQEAGFGLGQQRGTESGTRKTGFISRLALSRKLTMLAEAFTQENSATDATRQVAQGEVRYQSSRGTLGFGLRTAVDENNSGVKTESEQAFVNTSVQALNNRLTLRAAQEFSLRGKNANTGFPKRTLLGMDYRLHEKFTVYAEHEIAEGDRLNTQTTRAGVRVTPWERANINATVNQQSSEYGPRVFANVGLVQGIQINERWTVDAGIDHGNTIKQPDAVQFDTDTAPASGAITEDFTAVFLGALYRNDYWSASSRLEYRNSDQEQRQALLFGLYREEDAGKGFTLNAQILHSASQNGTDLLNADVRLGWSYRPFDSKWILFDRLDLVYSDASTTERNSHTYKMVNNLNANWMYSRETQITFQYGAKYVRSDIAGNSYSGFSDLLSVAYRHDLSERWDVGLHGNVRHSWQADVYDYSLGLEGGVTFARNAWLSLGYNFTGFKDDDFAQAGYLAQGPYLKFRLKADQHTFKDLRRGMLFRRENHDAGVNRRRAGAQFPTGNEPD